VSESFLGTVAAITELLNSRQRDEDTVGVLARALRWHDTHDADDLAALLALGELVRRKQGPGGWEVERAVLEILCEQAEVEHVPFLVKVFRGSRGRHGNDRRRLALQALSGVAARTGHEQALRTLEEGLAHAKKDTRGWAIGFVVDSYQQLGRPLPQSVIARLRFLAENDVSPDVRMEAVLALANLGLADKKMVEGVLATAPAQANSSSHEH
jgi:hypothetical protein